jgi:hypothetical protein
MAENVSVLRKAAIIFFLTISIYKMGYVDMIMVRRSRRLYNIIIELIRLSHLPAIDKPAWIALSLEAIDNYYSEDI